MALPKITAPVFTVTLPSDGTKVVLRPFTVKEEKILLTAREVDSASQSVLAVKQVITNCIVEGPPVEKLATIDFEFLLLTLRSKSVDNMVEFAIKDPETDEPIHLKVDIDDAIVNRHPDHTNTIQLSGDSGYHLVLRYPTFEEFTQVLENPSAESNYTAIRNCLDKLVSGDEVYDFADVSDEEADEFLDDIQSSDLKKITFFFETMPKLRYEFKYTNSKGTNQTYVIEGIRGFFI